MSIEMTRDNVDIESLHDHLTEALDAAESESAKYHIREACQKLVILEKERTE
jgi:cytidylate kinase